MIELQRSGVVQQTRSAFQVAMEQRFIAAVERLSGREVLLFMPSHHVGPDLEVEVFMLKPVPSGAVLSSDGDERGLLDPRWPELGLGPTDRAL
jgi:hypothetical protein